MSRDDVVAGEVASACQSSNSRGESSRMASMKNGGLRKSSVQETVVRLAAIEILSDPRPAEHWEVDGTRYRAVSYMEVAEQSGRCAFDVQVAVLDD